MKIGLWSFAAVLLFACTKERSLETGGNGGTLLVQSSSRLGSDSTVVQYRYDAEKRLIGYQTAAAFQGQNDQSSTTFTRNGQGIVQKVVFKSSLLLSVAIDSIPFNVSYDAARQRYTSRTGEYDLFGSIIKDSIAYTYDAGGRLIKEEEFIDDSQSGGYGEFSKTDYTYDAEGNVIKSVISDFDPVAGTYEAISETLYEYDANVNPLELTIEGFVVGNPSLISSHNVAKVTTTDLEDATSETVTYTYVYNFDKKPVSGTATINGSGGTITVTFIYQ